MFPQPPRPSDFQPEQLFQNNYQVPRPSQMLNNFGGYPYDPYQIKQGDTFDSIATNTGFDVPALQQANGGMLVPPPKGSFINLPQAGRANVPTIPRPQASPFYTQAQLPAGTNNVSPYRLGGITGVPPVGYGPNRPQNTPPNLGTGVIPSGYGLSTAPPEYIAQVQANINQQVSAGGMPDVVPLNTPIINPATGQPVTPAQMVANGYTMNQQTGQWIRNGSTPTGTGTLPGNTPGTPGATATMTDLEQITLGRPQEGFQRIKASEDYAGFVAQNQAFLNAKRYDPERKKFVSIRQLVNEGRLDLRSGRMRRPKRGGGGGGQSAPAEPEGFRGSPTERVNSNQGGG